MSLIFAWFYFSSSSRGQEPAGKAGRAPRLPFSPVSDESRVDTGSGSSNAARQLYKNTITPTQGRGARLFPDWLEDGTE